MINEKKMIRRLQKVIDETEGPISKRSAAFREVIKMMQEEGVNEDIHQRIQRAIGPQDSPGACHELEYARSLGKPVIYQEDSENVE